jgi:hypothetical protein
MSLGQRGQLRQNLDLRQHRKPVERFGKASVIAIGTGVFAAGAFLAIGGGIVALNLALYDPARIYGDGTILNIVSNVFNTVKNSLHAVSDYTPYVYGVGHVTGYKFQKGIVERVVNFVAGPKYE